MGWHKLCCISKSYMYRYRKLSILKIRDGSLTLYLSNQTFTIKQKIIFLFSFFNIFQWFWLNLFDFIPLDGLVLVYKSRIGSRARSRVLPTLIWSIFMVFAPPNKTSPRRNTCFIISFLVEFETRKKVAVNRGLKNGTLMQFH